MRMFVKVIVGALMLIGGSSLVLASVASVAEAASSSASLKRQIGKLKRQKRALQRENGVLRGSLLAVTGERDRLAAEVSSLKGPIPEQVRAVAREGSLRQLFQLVVLPAHGAWVCGGSVFFGQTFWSVDFDTKGPDGCY